ncbi:telethonin isoform X2 [Hippoglossus hippoglossus]|uniref:telethonin isoform X2 n=1 Tax=Hippoglossus hippoglossus TaxID=8267 RepID=UPI00148DEBB5|nr:telethonin isoform X2 [Hippoglossus hippoglossus]
MHCVSRGGCYLVNSHCDIHEDNQWSKESLQVCWLSLIIETRPQYKLKLSETDKVRRESYKLQQVVHFMVERGPSQTVMVGTLNGATKEHHLPVLHTGRDPGPARATSGCTVEQPATQERMNDEVNKQKVTDTTQDLRKPIRVNFRASSLMSSPRENSHRAQRRE